ncbi:MAG: hypothetical protein ACYSTF_07570 [Planctomycetota bacterium]
MLKRFAVVVMFGIAFAYVEAAVVVYLREIFHADGFTFPLREFPISENVSLLLTEIGREAATIVLILASCWLIGRNRQQRFAYFLAIFAIWDIFYYVWLKILINWPVSIMDWDILFMIPTKWASPVLAPVIVSVIMLLFAVIMLYRNSCGVPLTVGLIDVVVFSLAALVVVVSFCIAGLHVEESDFQSYFYWPLFVSGNAAAIVLFLKCLLKTR